MGTTTRRRRRDLETKVAGLSNGDYADWIDRQVRGLRPLVERTYLQGLEQGQARPTVFLFDLEDPRARSWREKLFPPGLVKGNWEAVSVDRKTASKLAMRMSREFQPGLYPILSDPREGLYPVVVCTVAGGASTLWSEP